MDLSSLSDVGLPGWFIIIAASFLVLDKVGLLGFVTSRFADSQEHRQQSENVAIEILRSIIRESIQEYSGEMRDFDKTVGRLDKSIFRLERGLDNNTQAVRALAGAIESLKSERKD